MHSILHRAFPVGLYTVSGIEYLGFVKVFMVEAKDFLVLDKSQLVKVYWSHGGWIVRLKMLGVNRKS